MRDGRDGGQDHKDRTDDGSSEVSWECWRAGAVVLWKRVDERKPEGLRVCVNRKGRGGLERDGFIGGEAECKFPTVV